jgi:SAM-dependent methyltransferase
MIQTRIETLPRVVAAPPGKPVREGVADGQARARRLALEPATWDRDEAAGMAARFDQAAPDWESDRGAYRRPPLADALARGGPFGRALPGRALSGRALSGWAVEIASGTGLMTPLIQSVWPRVAALDLSPGMLARAQSGARIRADASRLPLIGARAAAVVICDGPLFAAEVVRVLAPGAPLVWSNALGRGAPFHLPTETLVTALADASGHPWRAVQSEAHWGSWAVLRPA